MAAPIPFSGIPNPVQGVTGGEGLPQGSAFIEPSTGAIIFTPQNNTVQIRRGANPQGLQIYNTFSDNLNFERANLFWGGNIFHVVTQRAGTGSARNIGFGTDANDWFVIDSLGHMTMGSDLTVTPFIAINTGFTGSTLASRWVGAVAGVAPTTGAHLVGDFVVDRVNGGIFVCTAAGTPGTWIGVSSGPWTTSTNPAFAAYIPPTTSLTSTGGFAVGAAVSPTLTANGNDGLWAITCNPTLVPLGFTALMGGILIVNNNQAGANATKVGIAIGVMSGANQNNYGMTIDNPTGASVDNFSLYTVGKIKSDGGLVLTAVAPTVAAGQVGLGATTAITATAGANGAVPAQVVGYLIINVAGTARKVPYFAT